MGISVRVKYQPTGDANKDQSYFLYRVTETALQKSLMPVGEHTKPQIRQLAKKFNLPTADKPDSQGICFIGEVSIKDFLLQYIKQQPGPIITMDGKEIGSHDGAVFYTIGQRHGLEVGGGRSFYVVGKDMKTNTVFVTDNPADEELHKANFDLVDVHWINEAPKASKTYQVRTRYRGKLVDGQLKNTGDKWAVKLVEPERAVTPGQSAVVYDGDRVLGGGVISLV